MAKILLIEDDQPLSVAIRRHFERSGLTVDVVPDGEDGLERLIHYSHDLAIVDWGLPGLSGLQVCLSYRSRGGSVPILMLTGKDTLKDKTSGLDAGADDYLTKPFAMEELMARVRALLRRPSAVKAEKITVNDLLIDLVAKTVSRDSENIKLVPREFAILELFLRNPNQVFSCETIVNRVWSSESECSPDTVRPYITQLRQKLWGSGHSPIETVHGFGYKFALKE